MVGHLCCNASYLINSLFDLDTELIELCKSDEGESEEENEELEEKDHKEYKESQDYQLSSSNTGQNINVILNLSNLKDNISKETGKPPPRF